MKGWMHRLSVVLKVVVLLWSRAAAVSISGEITQLGPCSCAVGDQVVDLTPLGNTDHTPRFKDKLSSYPFSYSWNPCYDFDEGACKGVAGCQTVAFQPQYYSLGSQSSAKFVLSDEGELQIMYQSKPLRSRTRRILYVTLACVEEEGDEKLEVNGERRTERAVYDMKLYSPHACPRSSGKTASTLSIGSITLIAVSGVVIVYFVTGIVVQKFVRKATGLETIPNVTIWSKVPGLVKDGCRFVVNRGKVDQMYQVVE